MRTRNPCVLERRRRFGWNVRFGMNDGAPDQKFLTKQTPSINDASLGGKRARVADMSGNWSQSLVLTHNLTVSSFGQDTSGKLYLLDYGNGAVLRLQAAP